MSLAVDGSTSCNPGETVHLAGYDWKLVGCITRPARITRPGRHHRRQPQRRADHHAVARTAALPDPEHHHHRSEDPHNLFRDLYAVLGDERDGAAVLRLHDNFLAPWIWLGALIMGMGGLPVPRRPAGCVWALRRGPGAGTRRQGGGLTMPINRRTMLIATPLGVAVAAGAGFLAMLRGMEKGTFDPRGVPTMLSNQPVPPFELPALARPGSPPATYLSPACLCW